ncbi:MAG: hypothetical protein JWO78_1548 [Micavibrio sp.]|nr:hypothetical protein [Micavibrio sp.]
MKASFPGLAIAFAIPAVLVAALSAGDDFAEGLEYLNTDPDISRTIDAIAGATLSNAIRMDHENFRTEFKGAQRAGETNRSPTITYNALSRQLCRQNFIEGDELQPVCYEDADLSRLQRGVLRNVLCIGAILKSDKAYQQLFCGPVKMT